MDGVGIPGARVPSVIRRRSSAARRTYALGSDSSLIDTLVPYSIGNIANRNASTLVEIRRHRYGALTWTARSGSGWTAPSGGSGTTDRRSPWALRTTAAGS